MVFGIVLGADNGYKGRREPVNWNEGKGLYCPVAGSGSETTFGGKRLERILLFVL